MATKKLSEALAELQKTASIEGLDVRLVVAGNSSTDNAKTITLQQLLTALNVPTVQTGVVGNNQQYVYSVSSDNTHAVMSGTFKAFQYKGQCLIRHKFWGSTNDYNDGQYTTREIPKVTTSANGVFEAAMLVRLLNTTLTEVNSTTDKVVVSYPNYANGSTKSLEISKATTAKAGVMTAEQVKQLQDLVNNPTSGSAQYLKWDSANHKYTYVATEAESDAVIPIASGTKDGLMSKTQVADLESVKTKVENLKDEIPTATEDSNGLMSISQVTDLKELKKTAKRKKTTFFPPCVHKAIPLRPKKGRCYFNAKGEFHFNVDSQNIKNGACFKYVEGRIGKLINIKKINFSRGSKNVLREDLYVDEKFFIITKDNWDTLFGDAERVQFTIKVSEYPCCIQILSDESITFSDDFDFQFYNNPDSLKETASPYFKIDKSKVVYNKQLTKGYFSIRNCIAYYCKKCKKKTTIKGKKVSVSKRWKEMKWSTSYFKLNNRSLKYRLYPFRQKWNKKYIGNEFIEVLRDHNGKIKKILP